MLLRLVTRDEAACCGYAQLSNNNLLIFEEMLKHLISKVGPCLALFFTSAVYALDVTITDSLSGGEWYFTEVSVPAEAEGWRIVVSSDNGSPRLYVREGADPTTSQNNASGMVFQEEPHHYTETITLSDADLSEGTWHIGVRNASGSELNFTLRAEEAPALRELQWDPGESDVGTEAWAETDGIGGLYFFSVTTQNTALGAWRQALRIDDGHGQLFYRENNEATPTSNDRQTEISDQGGGFIIPKGTTGVTPNTRYLTVAATPGASWSVVAGDVPVFDLGDLATDDSSGSFAYDTDNPGASTGEIPVEGTRFFRTSIPVDTAAWHLWIQGSDGTGTLEKEMRVRTGGVPTPGNNGQWDAWNASHDRSAEGQALLVPPYLDAGGGATYFVALIGDVGTEFRLDSRQQPINPINFDETSGVHGGDGSWFHTFQIPVPSDTIGWEITSLQESGDPFLAVRRDEVPNADENDAYSEIPGEVDNSVTLVPPDLNDGTYYVTVYGEDAFTFQLRNRAPEVTTIDYASSTENMDTDRVGWRYFVITDIESQLGNLGWLLDLVDAAPDAQVAIRRNALPGSWNYRINGNENDSEHWDDIGPADFLQSPQHQADVWYVGIYSENNPLGGFTLNSGSLSATVHPMDGTVIDYSGLRPGEWVFYRFDVTEDIEEEDFLGWELRVLNQGQGLPGMVLRRSSLPATLHSSSSIWGRGTNWSSDAQMSFSGDWTGRNNSADGSISQEISMLSFGEGQPLVPGTYYLGLQASVWGDPLDFRLETRTIGLSGSGMSHEVETLSFDGGSSSGVLDPRDVAYYRVEVPEGAPNWRVRLDVEEGDEAQLYIRKDFVPNRITTSRTNADPSRPLLSRFPDNIQGSTVNGFQVGLDSSGGERFDLWPRGTSSTTLEPGTYYLMVVSEGRNPSHNNRVGADPIEYTLVSEGEITVQDLGLLESGEINVSGSYASGSYTYYQFEMPENHLGVELRLEDTEGNPHMRLRQDEIPPAAHRILSFGSNQHNAYGHYNGRISQWDDSSIITLTDPGTGIYSITIGERITNQMEEGSFTLRVSPMEPQPADFDGFTDTVSDLGPGEWAYYEVNVPETLNGEAVLGWDVRVTEWSGGTRPYILIRPDALPSDPNANFNPGGMTSWSISSTDNSVMKHIDDWTGRNLPASGSGGAEQYNISLPMGQPLSPGTYFIGFRGLNTSQSTTFTWTSKAITESGSGASYEVADLDYEDGSATGTLDPREVTFFSVDVPEGVRSWQIALNFDDPEDEGRLYLRKDYIPNSHATTNSATANPTFPVSGHGVQVRLDKDGGERFVLWPNNGADFIEAGRYFLMVVSEGKSPDGGRIGEGSISFELLSQGEVEIVDLGVLPSAGEVVQAGAYDEGMQSYYHFEVPEGLLGLELRLEDRVGDPRMNLRAGVWPTSVPNAYGAYSGHTSNSTRNNELITMSSPDAGVYTMMITHASGSTFNPGVDAGSYTFRINSVGATDIHIDGYTDTVEDLPASEWTYYRLELPDEINGEDLLAWELSVTEWSGDEPPAIVIQKGSVPTSVNPSGAVGTQGGRTTMNDGDRIVISDTSPLNLWTDWSRRSFSADGTQEFERITHSIPIGQPLVPGEYYIGFRSRVGGQAPLTFTWESRAVTLEGSGVSHEVKELEFDGSQSGTLEPREIQHYYVDLPEETKSWQIELDAPAGQEVRMHIRGVHMVNTLVSSNASSYPANWNGSGSGNEASVHMTHSGKQTFVLWPEFGDDYLTPGRYYITVVGLGQMPSAEDRVGTGSVNYTLSNLPEAEVTDLGELPLAGQLLIEDETYAAGEIHYYRFEIPEGTPAVEAIMRDRTGTPRMALIPGEYGPRLTYGSLSFPQRVHGQYSGKTSGVLRSDQFVTLTNPEPGIYTLAISHGDTPGYGSGGYTLEINAVEPGTLEFGFGGNTSTGQLAVGQSDYYQIDVTSVLTFRPEPSGDDIEEDVLGWRLRLYDDSGEAEMRVRFGSLPEGTSNSDQSRFVGKSALIVPPYLEEGEWYIEVRGVTASTYTLESVPVTLSSLEREPWEMPDRGEPSLTPGLSAAQIGDTGVDANGDPLSGDQGIDLSNGDFHLYAIEVPEDNGGLLRTVLESISGDSDLYIRAGALPTHTHGTHSASAAGLSDHRMTGSDITEYGSWVPHSILEEETLSPGLWFLKVRADGDTNARYRLRLSHNADTLVQDLDLNEGILENQTLAGTDWRYYRVDFPEDPEDMPEQWILNFTEIQGNVVMYIRDTAPPGLTGNTSISSATSYQSPRDWSNNNVWRNPTPRRFTTEGTHVIEGVHLRPGKTYYVGFRASQDSMFTVTSDVGGQTMGDLYGQILSLANDGGYVETTLQPGQRISWAVDVPKDTPRWRHLAWHDAEVELTVTRNFLPHPGGSGNYHISNGNADSGRDSNLSTTDRARNQTFYVSMINNSTEEQPVALLVDLREAGEFEIDFTIVGGGSVETDPELYSLGDPIEVTAIPEAGWSFGGWSGDYESTDNPITVTPLEAFALTATFEEIDTGMVTHAEVLTDQTIVQDGAGDPIEIEVTLSNPESTAQPFSAVLNIDSGVESWQITLDPVMIDAGSTETITVSYDLAGVYPGSPYSAVYSVAVNGYDAGTFNGIYMEALAYWSDDGWGEIEIGDYEEIGYRIYSLPEEAISLEIEIRANGDLIHSETANVAAGSSPSWSYYVWYGTEPGEYEVRINDILAVGSPVIFYDPDAPDPGEPDPEGEIVITDTSVTGNLAPGETISFNAALEETTGDAAAEITLEFSIDGVQQGTDTVSLGAGQGTGLVERFTHVFSEPGVYDWSINEVSGQVRIDIPVINVETENLTVSRDTVYSGHFVRVEADVTNLDDFEGEHEVSFTVRDLIGGPLSDGPVEILTDSRTLSLDANESQTVTFHYLIEFEGSFDFAIGDQDPLQVDAISAWAQRGHGHGNMNAGSFEAPMFNIGSNWTYAAGDQSFHYVRSTPVVVDGVVYVGSWPSALHAIDVETGELVWDEPFAADSAVVTSPAVADGRAFITTSGAGGTTLYAVDITDGSELWSAEDLGDTDLTAPLVVDSLVYVGSDSGHVRAFHIDNGNEAWSHDMGAEVHATPAYGNGMLFVGSDNDVRALDALTGVAVWSEPYSLAFVRSGLVLTQNFTNGDWVLIAGSMTGALHAIDASTGDAYWADAFDADGMIQASPAVAGLSIYVVTDSGFVHQVDLDTGTETGWTSPFEADGGIVGSPVYANSRIHFGTTEGTLYAVPGFVDEPQPVWTYDVGAPLRGSLAIYEGVIYLGDDDAIVHALGSGGEDPGPGPIVPDAPDILTQPASQEIDEGDSVTFTVEADGEGTLEYQWFKDDAAISGADEASFTISAVSPTDVGSYYVTVTNDGGSVESDTAALAVRELPRIVSFSPSAEVVEGGSVSFTVQATGAAPLSYQWRKDGTVIDGVSGSTLSITGVSDNNIGSYTVTVSNALGSVQSNARTLNVLLRPRIVSGPQDQTAAVGESVTFSVNASGDGELSYRWSLNGVNLTGFTENANYTVPFVGTADAGVYQVEVSSEYGQAEATAMLTVSLPDALPLPFVPVESTDNPNYFISQWFGGILIGGDFNGWVFSDAHGWIHVWPGQPEGMLWFYHLGMLETLYTTSVDYPALFSFTYGWLYYTADPDNENIAWYYRYDDETWFWIEL